MATSSAAAKTATYTITAKVGATLATTLAAPAASKAAEQSVLAPPHTSPTVYDPSKCAAPPALITRRERLMASTRSPIVVFIIQAVIIISLSAFLGIFLKRIRQPRVISEVIGGIILSVAPFPSCLQPDRELTRFGTVTAARRPWDA